MKPVLDVTAVSMNFGGLRALNAHEHSPVAQLAEQVAVNHRVGSSNLSRGARLF